MRLVLVLNALLRHGPGIVVYTLAKALQQRNFSVTIVSLDPPDNSLMGELIEQQVDVISPSPNQSSFSIMRQVLAGKKPHIVHTHGLRADIAGRIAARLYQVPVLISTVHDSPDMYAMALGQTKGAMALQMQMLTLNLVRRAIMVSELTSQEYRVLRPFRHLSRRYHTIYNGVRDCTQLATGNGATKPETDTLRIGTLVRLTYRKGIHILIEAAEQLSKTYPHVRFAVAGEGEMADALQQQIGQAGLQDIFVLTGPQSDVPNFLAGLDIFALPSLDECLPLAVLEAMSAGKPIVATDVGGVSEAIKHRVNGLLIPPQDKNALITVLSQLIDDDNLRQKLATAARRHYLERFTQDAMIEQHVELYYQLI